MASLAQAKILAFTNSFSDAPLYGQKFLASPLQRLGLQVSPIRWSKSSHSLKAKAACSHPCRPRCYQQRGQYGAHHGFSSPSLTPLESGRKRPSEVAAAKKTFSSFEDMLSSGQIVLVDFYATWCGPCQLMAQELQVLAARSPGRFKIVKIDTDKYPQIASKYGVQALPTVIIFSNGKPVDRLEGAVSADEMLRRLNTAVAS
eukprot:jgi/Mesen1/1534/ME000133S00541